MSKKIIGLISLVVVAGLFLVPTISLAQSPPSVTLQPSPTEPPELDPVEVISTIIQWIFGFLLAIVVLMVIIAGYMFVTGGGNPDQIGKARNFLMYALIGLAVAVLARGLVALVLRIIWQTT